MNLPFLSLLTFVPLAGAIILLFVPKTAEKAIKGIATVAAAIPVVLSAMMVAGWGSAAVDGYGMKFAESFKWIEPLGVTYYMGTDGISFSMLILTALLTFLAVLASFSITKRLKEYFILLLFLEVGMMGVFAALDYFLFFIFWEIVLVPMYFLIGIWGGPRREYAAIKFFIYTLIGSVVMLIAILAMYLKTGAGTFNILEIAKLAPSMPFGWQWWIFLGLFLGFAIKVPVFPFHTWLPDAHVEAPTPVSMILAGVLLKMGTYAMLRISHATLPEAAVAFSVPLAILGFINIVYGALAAMAQKDLKKMVAYSSVSHMGYFLLGLAAATPEGINGAIYVMVSHGLISGLFFFVVGMSYERTHTREIAKLGGLFLTVPVIATVTAFTAFANLGLPTLSGFIGEFFVLLGAWPVYKLWVLVAGVGLVVTAAFHLWMVQRVLMGEKREEYHDLEDINAREVITLVPLVALIIYLGVYPRPLLELIDPAVKTLSVMLGGM
ncbi:MAG: NADH-quinone oxidoreductase subunit M [Actinobacteria bacterium]|nr:NADH-quinone oxidoreductase subunit M [Actinomycetota bacterium]